MNELSAQEGSWKKLHSDCKKYSHLQATAEWLSQYENTQFLSTFCGPMQDFVTKTEERQCPVETTRILEHKHPVPIAEKQEHQLYNVIRSNYNDDLIILPADAGLSDIAFEIGWRIIHPACYLHEAQRYEDRHGALFYTEADFHSVYLQDLDSDDFTGEMLQEDIFYQAIQPDSDDEEIDVEFYGEDEPETTEE